MTALLAAACAGTAVVAALHRPGAPARLRPTSTHRARWSVGSALATIGAVGRRPLGLPADLVADRRLGAATALAGAAVLLGIEAAALLLAAGTLRSRWRRARAARTSDAAEIQRDLPELIDLVALAVGAGLSVPATVPVVAPVAPASLRDDLTTAVDGLAGGRSADEVISALGRRWGEPARPLIHALADHLRYGTPVLPALERVATEARAARRRAAEIRARKLPVLLLFPLVLCTLPAFGLLTVAPLVAGTLDTLQGSRLEAPASLAP